MSDAKIETMVMITGREYEALRAEVERLKTSGIAEVAAHNPSVMDWIHHWERRTLKAEAENEKLRAALEPLACTCDRPNGAACSRSEVDCPFWNARAALEGKQ